MEDLYLPIRTVHVTAVVLSGALFAARALGANVFQARWAMAAPVRYLSYAIDTILLAAALLLLPIVRKYPFVDAWLSVKVLLVAAYIVLGSFALKRARTRPVRLALSAAALGVFFFIITIAVTRHPLGLFLMMGAAQRG